VIRASVAVMVGVVIWFIVATGLDILLRLALPGYAAAEPQLHFTLGMMTARLALPGAVPSVVAGFASSWISRGNRRALAALTIILVALFLPAHYQLWTKFPAWYHLTFFTSLILLTWLGARLRAQAVNHRLSANPLTSRPS
jgi:hypothetical protein